MKKIFVYIGTYTIDSNSKGIYVYQFDLSTGSLTRVGLTSGIDNPSFLRITADGQFLYSVSEVAEVNGVQGGTVSGYAINKQTGALTYLNSRSTHGAYPCHLNIDQAGQYVMVSNYMGGNFAMLPIQKDGTLEPATDVVQHKGCSNVNPARQEGPHAHSVTVSPDNKFALAADLGKDVLISYKIDVENGKLLAHKNGQLEVAPGDGPRHMDFHPNGRFVFLLNELGNSINSYRYKAESGTIELIDSISSLPNDFNRENISADIHVHPNGKFLYASNRGHDSIIICSINEKIGTLEVVGFQSTMGAHPRNFSIDPTGNFLLVANKDSNSIVIFNIDNTTGELTPNDQQITIPQPVCIAFMSTTDFKTNLRTKNYKYE